MPGCRDTARTTRRSGLEGARWAVQESEDPSDVLFVEPNPGRSNPTFFTDRVKGELWVGPRLGVKESQARHGVHEARGLPELQGFLEGLRGVAAQSTRVLRGHSAQVDGALPEHPEHDKQLATALSEMRLLKDKPDITRTLPISGRFSREQRDIYELVLEAQDAAIEAVKPGNDFMEPNRVAMRVLAEGLYELGILKTTPEEALKDERQFYKRYSLHNVSHMLGLDVHDCAQARQEAYKYGKLKAGMVLTVEPGLYFQKDDLTVPAKYRGIGVRIEDDVLVTKTGCRVLSEDIPREARDIEAWMKQLWSEKR